MILQKTILLIHSIDYNLSMLIGKGIIYRDKEGTLKLFNKGFQQFHFNRYWHL